MRCCFPSGATTGYAYDFAALRLADMISGICFPNPAEGPRIRLLEVLLLGEPGPAPLDDLRALDHDPLCGGGGKVIGRLGSPETEGSMKKK